MKPRLALSLRPTADELLSSYLMRLSWAHGLTPYRGCRLLWPKHTFWNRDIDRSASDVLLGEIADMASLSSEAVAAMTLRPLEAITSANRRGRGAAAWILVTGTYHLSRRRHGLQFCPQCLKEQRSIFQRRWRLGFVLVCEQHNRALRDACPHCDAPITPHRLQGDFITTCYRCRRSLTAENAEDGQPSSAVAEFQTKLWQSLMKAQVSTPDAIKTSEYFSTLRTLLSLMTSQRAELTLRRVYGLPADVVHVREGGTFEHARWQVRANLLETLAVWTSEWPRHFFEGAASIGLTQRSFVRHHLTPALADQIRYLPTGNSRNHPSRLRLYSPEMRRLRRVDVSAYRNQRAQILLGSGWRQ